MPDVTDDDKLMAKRLAAKFGGTAKVSRFWDDAKRSAVDILRCEAAPEEAVASYATVSLSNTPVYQDGKATKIRAEILGACESAFADFGNVVATCAFNAINDKAPIAPGVVHKHAVAMYKKNGAMRHILFHDPFLWEDLGSMILPSKTVAFVLAIPISDSEGRFLHEKGYDALTDRFEAAQIDLFDIDRDSVV